MFTYDDWKVICRLSIMLKKGISILTSRYFQVRKDMSPRMSSMSSATLAEDPGWPASSSSMISIIASLAPVSTNETACERSFGSAAVATSP